MHTDKLTKIVATIGPASESPEVLAKLMDAGVNVFRFNTKHSTPEWHGEHIKLLQKIADEKGKTVGILLDLQGPEVRLETRDKVDYKVEGGTELVIGLSFVEGINVIIPHAQVFKLLKPGQDLLVDDGFIETEVVKVEDDKLTVKVKNDATFKHRKGVNLPGVDVDFPSLIDRDIEQLNGNARIKIDYVGLSFVRSARDIKLLRKELEDRKMTAKIVAKIESQPAIDRIDEIIKEADAVMVARGDLGVEVPFEQLAYWQRTIIDKCRVVNKPVITATQMLESMINNPRPTRAEVTDVAHAVFDGTDAIMLSGESAGGKYPVRTVETMAKIAKWNESRNSVHKMTFTDADPTSNIASAVVNIVKSVMKPDIDAVLVFTETGYTARCLAKYRLMIPVIAATEKQATAESLTLSYGVHPVKVELPAGPFSSAENVIKELIKREVLHKGQNVVVVHGYHWQKPGNTNALAIVTV
jgi:pyruvate kinase